MQQQLTSSSLRSSRNLPVKTVGNPTAGVPDTVAFLGGGGGGGAVDAEAVVRLSSDPARPAGRPAGRSALVYGVGLRRRTGRHARDRR